MVRALTYVGRKVPVGERVANCLRQTCLCGWHAGWGFETVAEQCDFVGEDVWGWDDVCTVDCKRYALFGGDFHQALLWSVRVGIRAWVVQDACEGGGTRCVGLLSNGDGSVARVVREDGVEKRAFGLKGWELGNAEVGDEVVENVAIWTEAIARTGLDEILDKGCGQ